MSTATALKIQGVRKPKLMTMYKIRTKELGAFFKALNLLFGSPAWIRTTIHGSKGRCPTIRRPGNKKEDLRLV
jgi:hypothetical protein